MRTHVQGLDEKLLEETDQFLVELGSYIGAAGRPQPRDPRPGAGELVYKLAQRGGTLVTLARRVHERGVCAVRPGRSAVRERSRFHTPARCGGALRGASRSPASQKSISAIRPSFGTGTGLQGLRERVGACGGALESGATPQGGWRLAARLPQRVTAATS